jgi:hypothetical protein
MSRAYAAGLDEQAVAALISTVQHQSTKAEAA